MRGNTIRAAHNGKCLDVANASTANLGNVHQWGCHGGNNQKWNLNGPQTPNLIGMSPTNTKTALVAENLNLSNTVTYQDINNREDLHGKVAYQYPLAGQQVNPLSSVALKLYKSNPPVPDIIGKLLEPGKTALRSVGLINGLEYVVTTNTAIHHKIISTNPIKGTIVTRGTRVGIKAYYYGAPTNIPSGLYNTQGNSSGCTYKHAKTVLEAAGFKVTFKTYKFASLWNTRVHKLHVYRSGSWQRVRPQEPHKSTIRITYYN